jgi:GT2 family glycosyltransferase
MRGRKLPMLDKVPIAAIIPTYNRGVAVVSVLEKIQTCHPKPAEIWVHIDSADGALERVLYERFPHVRVLTSQIRLGCSGGRHRCFVACTSPYAVTFDDDSYPVDADFFARLNRLFLEHPRAAIFGASIWHRHEPEKVRADRLVRTASHMGCGFGIRLAAYREVRGCLPRPVGYGLEENDLSLQLFARGWHTYEAEDLRVFHDTDRRHHEPPDVTSGTITNIGLCAFLHYPIIGWGRGIAQVVNIVLWSIRRGRLRGICSGILRIPIDCYRNRRYRQPIAWPTLKRYLELRRTVVRN